MKYLVNRIIQNRENKTDLYKIASFSVILIGLILRLYHYFVNRSLWLDEALLSNNIINRDFKGLLETLDNRQIAPIGFLILQKMMTLLFGVNEYALRLVPLLSSLASVVLFYLLLKRIFPQKLVILGLIFFVFGRYLLYYSHEAKPYNLDLFLYILALYLFYQKDITNDSYPVLILKGIVGGIMVWFSHISLVILSSLGFILFINSMRKRNLNRIIKLLIPTGIWAISMLVNYLLFMHNSANESIQVKAFDSINYFPPDSLSSELVYWLYTILIHLIQYPLGTLSGIFIAFIMLLGTYQGIKSRNYRVLLMGLPILVHLVLSYFRSYPFYGRFILYSSVYVIVLIIMGFQLIMQWKPRLGFVISALMVIVFMLRPIKNSFQPFYFEEIRPAIAYIAKNSSVGEVLYVHPAAIHSFSFYQPKFNLPQHVHEGEVYNFNGVALAKELYALQKPGDTRVWFLFSHVTKDQEQLFINKINSVGEIVDGYEAEGASAYLFKLKK